MAQGYTTDQPLDTDVNLGGGSPLDYIAASQKATKTYVDNRLSSTNATDLTDGGVTSLHFHSDQPFVVKNTSGASAAAGDVGYIDSAGEYKTTTTASLNASWCVVFSGGANNADIYVTRRGRASVKYTGSAPSAGNYLTTSTVAGSALAQTTVSPEIFAVCLASGSGGVVSALLLTERTFTPLTSTNEIFRLTNTSDTSFSSTINGTPGATLVYNAPTGNEDSIVPAATTQLAKLILWNTSKTPDEYALIQSTNTGTNTITPTATITGWSNGESIQVNSTAVTGFTFYDLQILDNTTIPALVTSLTMEGTLLDSGTGQAFLTPYIAGAVSSSRYQTISPPTAGTGRRYLNVPIYQRRFCIAVDASGTATSIFVLRILGYYEATP